MLLANVDQFVDIGSRECYVGMLYACYDLIPPHVVLEVSWRNGLHDFTMVSYLYTAHSITTANDIVAIYDQLPRPTGRNHRDAQEGQRGA